jgi:cell division protease FtsH
MLEHASPLLKVTIIPRGRALGAAWYLPEERQLTTREQILDEMAYALGGRASEELVFGRISTGALSDLEKITKQAYAMVSFFGMSDKVGNISFYDSSGQSDFGFTKPYSEKTAELIDQEVNLIISESYVRAKEVLKNNMKGLTELAELLLEKEVIFSEDLERIFGKRKADLLKDEREAEAKSALLLSGNEVGKEVKKGKKSLKPSSEKTKAILEKNEPAAEKVSAEKKVKKAKSKVKE